MSTELRRYDAEHRYSDATVYNGVVYVVGQMPETTLDAGITEQTVEVLAVTDRMLIADGSDKMRILMCQIFLKDVNEIGEMNRVWDRWVTVDSKNSPPHATVEAALANPEYRTEIVVMAVQKN